MYYARMQKIYKKIIFIDIKYIAIVFIIIYIKIFQIRIYNTIFGIYSEQLAEHNYLYNSTFYIIISH